MKHFKKGLALTACLCVGLPLANAAEALKTPKEQVSYVFGVRDAQRYLHQGIKLDAKAYNQAVKDVWSGSKLKMSPEAMQVVMQQFQQEMIQRMQQAAANNLEAGKAYREKNKKTKGVVELQSGVQYKVLKKGSGKKPSPTDTVVVHYHGTLVGGQVFDSSVKRGEPWPTPVNGVILGWQEILPMMPVGSKWQVVIPPEKAYGADPRGPGGPNSTLIFEIELISIK